MKSALFKKSIIVVAAIVFLAGVSLFAYWMSDISAPDEKDEEIPITIGVGAAVGTNLKVKEKLYKEGLNFVPEDRDPDDIVNENSTSEVVFELTIAWIHVDEKGDLIDEQGVLLAAIESFTFYDRKWKAYGNWALNASYAGHHGLHSRVEFVTSTTTLRDYINKNIPLALSIRTTSTSQLRGNPGSPMSYSSGHLIVLVGFESIGGVWHAVVNDPAVSNDSSVRRKYRLDDLAKVMSGYVYVVSSSAL